MRSLLRARAGGTDKTRRAPGWPARSSSRTTALHQRGSLALPRSTLLPDRQVAHAGPKRTTSAGSEAQGGAPAGEEPGCLQAHPHRRRSPTMARHRQWCEISDGGGGPCRRHHQGRPRDEPGGPRCPRHRCATRARRVRPDRQPCPVSPRCWTARGLLHRRDAPHPGASPPRRSRRRRRCGDSRRSCPPALEYSRGERDNTRKLGVRTGLLP